MSKQAWDAQHLKYADADWIHKPSIFAQYAVDFFPEKGRVLDAGCGQGQDSRFFAERGYSVTALDFSDDAIRIAREKSVGIDIEYRLHDISKPLPFDDATFDVVYSHLAIHYFDTTTTTKIFSEFYRVLKQGGTLALLLNSINDPEYGTGTQLEPGYFEKGDMRKRYFSSASLAGFVVDFKTIVLGEAGETYKDRAKGVSNLVRFIGTKV